jgi:uncharacterized protein YndB with AHSA1/START domain
MIESSVIHGTFTVERTFLATPSRVFRAFESAEARKVWSASGTLDDHGYELDFRNGGREGFFYKIDDIIYRYDARYYDIVPDQRIVYSYEMYADNERISVSVATIEFAKNGDGTALSWTEQGAYLDGIEGRSAPGLREEGTTEMVDLLVAYMNSLTAR